MNSIPEFVCEDLFSMIRLSEITQKMIRFSEVIQKMDKCIEDIKPDVKNIFGFKELTYSERFQDMLENKRCAIWVTGILPDEVESTILIGFHQFRPDSVTTTLTVHFFIHKEHGQYDEFMRLVRENAELQKQGVAKPEKEYGYYAMFDKPLSEFINIDNQFSEIKKWFIEKMKICKEFIDDTSKTSKLNWNLKN